MQQGIVVVNFGEYADPRRIVEIAVRAESAGWDALFVWDHLAWVAGIPSGDPLVALSGVAAQTSRIRLGTEVLVVARHRPHVLAHQVASLDRLSGGRLTLGVGLGAIDAEFAAFGEHGDLRTRAGVTDECLEVMSGLWSGVPVDHAGQFFCARGVTLAPLPVQRPRVPIWIGGSSAGAMRRAARWDGWFAAGATQDGRNELTPEALCARIEQMRQLTDLRAGPFDFVMDGYSRRDDVAMLREYADAGATWWLEPLHGYRGAHDELLARVDEGPAR